MALLLPRILDRAAGDGHLEVRNPFGGAPVAEVGLASAAELTAAIDRAEAARSALAAEEPAARAARLRGLAAAIEDRAEDFAALITAEAGKPIRLARGEVARAVRTFSLAAAEAERDRGEDLDLGDRVGRLERFPAGVCTAITPFNFPLNLGAHKVAPALAAGCPIVLKPAEKTPLSSLLLAELLAAAEPPLPVGAWAVLPALPAQAGPLVEDPRVRRFSFTGSAAVGWQLKRRAARARVTLELGGNAAALIAPDWDDLEAALDRCAAGAFAFSGQVCISLQRLFVPAARLEEAAAGLAARAEALRLGDPADEATDLGPLITEEAARRVEQWIVEATAGGARVRAGGRRDGSFVEPTVLTEVPREARLWREEAFGPVVVLAPYQELDQALAAMDDSAYGLQAAVFSRDSATIERAFRRLEVGQVIVGDSTVFRCDEMPYGGVKASGCGREGLRWSVEELTEPRLLVRWRP
ncbi:MAG: aldehyde dehydrogenase family protein [Planctomycetota bacterium]|nr:MAG: aldehyde dehydrogenase family protein [Planctomycetota bacterium]